jgi:histone H2A
MATESAPVFLAAIPEYLTVEVLELAGNAARQQEDKNLAPAQQEEELNQLLSKITIASAGVVPHTTRCCSGLEE